MLIFQDFQPFMEQLYGFVDWTEADKFDEETEIRRLVLDYAIRFDHRPALIKCNDLFEQAKENCRDPATFKDCHHLAASIRIPVYSAALIMGLHSRDYLARHLHSLKMDTVTSVKEWAEIEELVGILDQFDHSVSESEHEKKCYPIDDKSALLSRPHTF
uniref:NR LBD domain-containing protein n=1 Tax=Bursaphelenchus xylophilus TaxID=6326 RepID=A0A1I7RYY6_BURXY